jgi:peroxiredoxin
MKDLYAKYKDKGLVILGISADSKIDPWLKILPTLNNPWPQVWDNKDIMSEFAVTAFPTSFLIDPNGKILLKEIGYNPDGKSPMDQKLEEIFSK